jgi:CTP:molybdopterin cytidylyltransferase MocA
MVGRIASVLLAAGAATRFGGRKQLALLEGRPLLEHALAITAASGTDLTVVVLGAYAEEIEATVDLADARVVRAPDWKLGRSASLRAGLAALPEDVDAALITLGDEPYVSPATVARLLAARRPGLAAVRAGYAGRPGHPVLIERALFAPLKDPPPGRKPGQTLKAAGAKLVPCDDLGAPVDIDTPAQLAELKAHPPAQSGRPSKVNE